MSLSEMSGLEHLRRIRAGEIGSAPFGELIGGVTIAELEAGRVVFDATPDARHYNLIGTVHGGYTATLLDTAMGCAVHSTLAAGTEWTTLEIKINYVRAITKETGVVRCEGNVIHLGRTTAIADGTITDHAGKILARGTTTCLIRRA